MTDEEKEAEATEWIRSRPLVIQELMRRFPPGCEVRANRPLMVPAPGTTGRVFSYFEDGNVKVAGTDLMGIPLHGICSAEWLEVIGYEDFLTPEWVEQVLSAETSRARVATRPRP